MRGPKSVIRNPAYETEGATGDEGASAASPRPSGIDTPRKLNNYVHGVDTPTADSGHHESRFALEAAAQGAASCSGQADLPMSPATKRGSSPPGSNPSVKSPTSFMSPTGKRPKNAFMEVAEPEGQPPMEGVEPPAGGDDDDDDYALPERAAEPGSTSLIHVRHVSRGPSISTTSAATQAIVRAWEDDVKRLIAGGRHEEALRVVAPTEGIIRCTVRRMKNFLGHTTAYHMLLDSGEVFVLAARKRLKSKTSNFVLSLSADELGKHSESVVGKLRANFVGTEYGLAARTGSASIPSSDSSSSDEQSSTSGRLGLPREPFSRDEVAVHFKQTALTAKGGPRSMMVCTPLPDGNWAPMASDGSDHLAACLEAARQRELSPRVERQLCMLATRPPEWDPNLKSYTLDFHGRVRASSVKNFQLVHWDHNTDRRGSDLVLQFGKMEEGTDDFALDFAYPLTLQKAFGIALASVDTKLCYAM